MSKVELISLTPDAERTMAYIARVSNPKNQENEDYSNYWVIALKMNIGVFLNSHLWPYK